MKILTISQIGLHKTYVLLVALVCSLLLSSALIINLLVDPLWFWKGNQLTGVNFSFNERQAKLNLLLAQRDNYDCIIFGSSRVTLFQSNSVPGYRCFNLSFSAGQIGEFMAFADFIRGYGIHPKLVIIGVDGSNFYMTDRRPLTIPDYVQSKSSMPGIFESYLTIDALQFTWRTLIDKPPLPRYYTSHFDCAVRQDAPKFHPNISLEAEGLKRQGIQIGKTQNYSPKNSEQYKHFKEIFPEARFVAYVPPISAWHIAKIDQDGALPGYLESLYATSRLFDIFWDFSIPSKTTWITDNTYDGSHYDVPTNLHVARVLFGGATSSFGLNMQHLTMESYINHYRQSLEEFRAAIDPSR